MGYLDFPSRLFKSFKDPFRNKRPPLNDKLIEEFKQIEGFLTIQETVALYVLAAGLPPNAIIVEIGSWKGKSTHCIAKGAKGNCKIFAIDPFNAEGDDASQPTYEMNKNDVPLFEQFKINMQKMGVWGKIVPCIGYSNDFVEKFKTIDFLFIDGNHEIEPCRFDYEKFAPRIKKGGILAFHDFYPDRDELGPTWVIKNLVLPSGQYRLLDQTDTLWAGEKK